MEEAKSSKGKVDSYLPLARVKTIMKSSPDIEQIASDAVIAMARCTVSTIIENFVKKPTILLVIKILICSVSNK